MKKRIVSTLLALCMLLCLMPTAAFAEESAETPPVCSCETACTAESMNTDCPVCGAEGALPENCAKYAQPAEGAAAQPEGEVSDPQPEAALTALSGEGEMPAAGETVRDVRTADELIAAIADSSVDIVKLAGDISISSFLTVTRTVTLDLNGHVLQMTGNDRDPVIEVKKDSNGVGIGNLTLTDSASNTAHKFTPNADGLWVLDEENGTETVNGGVITGSKEMGIFVDGGYHKAVTQKPAEADCAHLIMTGGNIVGCAAAAGGGVYAGFYAYFTMTGGSIRGCVANAGGGVCLANSASFAMGGSALIADCISTEGGSCGGGGIGADLGALVALSGNAVIQNCTAQLGGGVYLNDATLTMSGNASVTGCNSIAGGGVYVRGNATESDPPVFTMEGSSSITDCTALNGGGIFVSTSGGKVSLSGSAKIKNCRTVERDGLGFPHVTGGGVHVSSGSFEMSGGSIEGCTAVNGGNSVFVCTGGYGKFTMTGGTVDGSITMPYTVGNEPVYMDGLGTAVSPYQISTADQLKLFRDIVNGSNGQKQDPAACAVLMNDIVLNDGTFDENGNYTTGASGKAVETWTPIAYSGPFTVDTTLYYTGTFDGQGHAIKGMYVSINDAPSIEDQVCLGLFSTAKNAVIRNVTVTGYVSGYAGNLGGIVGYLAGGTIENCANYCTVTDTSAAYEVTSYVGGIAGAVNCSAAIRDCYNTGKLTEYVFVRYHKTGGIVGYIGSSAVSNCYNVGKVAGKGWYNGEIIGFIAGEDAEETPSTINNCYYLNTTNEAVGNDADTVTNTGPKTAVQFGNGTVLALLINGRADSAHPWNSQCKYLAAAGRTLPVFKTQTGDEHTHDWSAWASNGDGTHSRRCACNAAETVNCSGGTATCTQKAKCTVCNAEYGTIDPANHTGTEQWTRTTTTHEKKWNCCNTVSVPNENHKWTDGVCSECRYVCQHKDTDKNHICDICSKTTSEHTDTDNNHICDYCNKKISDHTGGTATCKDKAVCEICKESYGSPDPNNHTDLKHIDAKAATAAEEGNIEYWYCDGCKKYFSDAAAKTEITEAATVTAKLPPQITAGDGAAVTQGEKNELTFTSNASFADFLRVELDGATLDEKNYTKREGSTIITLNRDFVATLSVGEHTLAIVSQHGTATAKFTVKAKPTETATPQPTETTTPQPTAQPRQTAQPQPTVQPTVQPVSPIPRTGDTANPALWFALLIVSGSALAAIFVLRRKANRK